MPMSICHSAVRIPYTLFLTLSPHIQAPKKEEKKEESEEEDDDMGFGLFD